MHTHTEYRTERASAFFNYHSIRIFREGCVIGYMHYAYMNKPFPFIYIATIHIDKSFKGIKLGDDILTLIEKKMKRLKCAGILYDGTERWNTAENNMYHKHGWRYIPRASRWRLLNPPVGSTEKEWRKAVKAIRKRDTRHSNKTFRRAASPDTKE